MNRLRSANATIEATRERISGLRTQILERNGRRSQFCGSPDNLNVHHQRPRGKGGDDGLENLITLCATCHHNVHEGSCACNRAGKSIPRFLGR
jgi:5-methylcytosine-specific restriction endonuclease McrA